MNIGKLLLLGGAAYLGYQYFLQPAAAQVAPSSSAGGIIPAAPVTSPATTRSLVLAEAAKQGYTTASVMNADNWNWFYKQARGIDGPDPALLGESRGPSMTFDEYFAWGTQHGLSGYHQASRLSVMELE